MKRFIVLDDFKEPIRAFSTKDAAKTYLRNKKGCSLREISLYEILGDCLF